MIKCPVEWPNTDAGDEVRSKMPFQKRERDTAPYYHHKWNLTGHQQFFILFRRSSYIPKLQCHFVPVIRPGVCPVVNPRFPTMFQSHPAAYSLARPVSCLISTRRRSLWPNTGGGRTYFSWGALRLSIWRPLHTSCVTNKLKTPHCSHETQENKFPIEIWQGTLKVLATVGHFRALLQMLEFHLRKTEQQLPD